MKHPRALQLVALAIAFVSIMQLVTEPEAVEHVAEIAPMALAVGGLFLTLSLAVAGLLVAANRVWRRRSQ